MSSKLTYNCSLFQLYSFIEYFSNEDAERAVQELNGKRLGGKRVTVSGITLVRSEELQQ
jgi:RNA recognition motif-containing protein